MYKFRAFESYGIYISITFDRNLDRDPAWSFIIESVEEELFRSGRFVPFELCEKEALKKAVEFL